MALTDNLISFFELDNVNDSHGSNNLTNINSVAFVTGLVGNAGDFELSLTAYLSHTSNASLQMGDIDFTICAWVNPESGSGITMQIVAKDDDAASSRDYTLDLSSLVPRFYINGGGGGLEATTASALSTATWYFLVARHDAAGDQVSICVNDGTVFTGNTGGAVPHTSAAEFRIGAREYLSFENHFDGLIDQVGLWKRKLSAAEITELYNAGAGRSYAYISGGTTGQPTERRAQHTPHHGQGGSLTGRGGGRMFGRVASGLYIPQDHRKAA